MSTAAAKGTKEKSASEVYQKLTQLEHVLKRPDTYIGSVEFHELPMWVVDKEGKMVNRKVKIVPGLYKCFDEIIVNAADNKVRDPAMKNIKVNVDVENQTISVFNDGRGIPIEMHQKEKMWVPELIFGNLLTSSNYDDNEQKVTGGRNGFGAKLCNIFSSRFELETADAKQVYRQVWRNNMSEVDPPEFSKNATRRSYTKITFHPDLAKFGMTEFDDDFVSLLRRRAFDMAGTIKGISVTLDDNVIPVKNFKGYVDLFVGSLTDDAKNKIIYTTPHERWEIAFALSDGDGFQQMSFVNSIATTSGGSHVDYIADMISKYVIEQNSKGQKAGKLQRQQVRNNMFLFVNCQITNPSFSSQTKEQLTSKVSAFGSRVELPAKFLRDSYKETGFDDRLMEISENNAAKQHKKQDGSGTRKRITEYIKLLDAQKAGTREGHKCTLILTEGDSAASSAKEGLKVIGTEYYGVFPLRGKVLNVREASQDQVMKNAEIKAIKQIIGLQHKKRYDSAQGLRYGHVMLMTDQDHDGSHIKGLIINFFESSFPGLLDVPGFLQEFITPIVKVTLQSGPDNGKVIAFYSMPQYESWRQNEGSRIKKWKIKYYKGLGTSEAKEMKKYFSDLELHEKTFHALQEGDKENIELAFSKAKADDRKLWLQGVDPDTHLDDSLRVIPISEFINKELILFSMADNVRSIPSVIDGLKPGQRKIMWVAMDKLRSETKLQSLMGMVQAKAKYHHGDGALSQTIVGLAQNFVGTNNIYWLLPIGAFGSRDEGGKDAGATRYIATNLNPITRSVFRGDDLPVLNYMQEDESTVEPEYFVPILPGLLVNGADGIGTGWSTTIPSYHPVAIVENLKRMIKGEALKPLTPWYRGWTGEIEKVPGSDHQWRVCGRIEEVDETTLAITELPVKMWTQTMKDFLNKSLKGSYLKSSEKDKDKERLQAQEFIDDMWEEHTDFIRFMVKLSPEEMRKAKQVGLYKKFKLIANLNTSNMVAFDPQGRLRRYSSPEEILKEFYHVRLDFYRKRREHSIQQMKHELERISSRARFIKMIVENDLVISNKKRAILEAELRQLKFPMFKGTGGEPFWPDEIKPEEPEENEDEDIDNADHNATGDEEEGVKKKVLPTYGYLLGMNIGSLTAERYAKLLRERGETEEALNKLLGTDIKDLWLSELDAFLEHWETFLVDDKERRMTDEDVVVKKPVKGTGRKRKAADGPQRDSSGRKRRAAASSFETSVVIPPPPIEEAMVKPKVARVKKESSTKANSKAASAEPSAADGKSSLKSKSAKSSPTVKTEVNDTAAPVSSESTMEVDERPSQSTSQKPSGGNSKLFVDDDSSDDDGGAAAGDDPFELSE